MRFICILALTTLAMAAQTAQPEEFSRIEGHVFRADTGAPVGKAAITLERIVAKPGPDDWLNNYSAVTDGQGAFTLAGIARAKYRLSASRNGFLDARYGAHGSQAAGAVVDLENPQKLTNVDFRLTPYGVVTGRIIDADGDPVVGAKVQFLRTHYISGKKALLEDAAPATNDLGEYRCAGLRPGQYYVHAEEFQGLSAPPNSKERYVGVYYPGVIDRSSAVPVDVAAGAQVRLADISLIRAPVVTAKGKMVIEVAGAAGRRTVTFYPDTGIAGVGSSRIWPAKVTDSGEFEAHNLTAGRYIVTASASQGGLSLVSAPLTVNVSANDIDGIVLTIRDPIVTKASVRVEGGVAIDWKPVRWKVRRGGPAGDASGYEWGSSIAPDGTFQIEETTPDRYGVSLNNLPDGFYLKSVRLGESDITNTGFDLRDGPIGQLELLISRTAGAVSGAAQNADGSQPVIGATVVLVPQEKERTSIPEYYPQATSDQFGRFLLRSVPPGAYRIYAWEEVEPTAWLDPEFMKPFENDGEAVKVEENGHASVTVKPLASPDARKR